MPPCFSPKEGAGRWGSLLSAPARPRWGKTTLPLKQPFEEEQALCNAGRRKPKRQGTTNARPVKLSDQRAAVCGLAWFLRGAHRRMEPKVP